MIFCGANEIIFFIFCQFFFTCKIYRAKKISPAQTGDIKLKSYNMT